MTNTVGASSIPGMPARIKGLGRINVLLGKNGCGKSRLLREIAKAVRSKGGDQSVRYITPERGGKLGFHAGIQDSLYREGRLRDSREKNLSSNFRYESIALLLRAETMAFRRNEGEDFECHLDKINSLLDNVEVKLPKDGSQEPKIFQKGSQEGLESTDISSGESELISLGIECISFRIDLAAHMDKILLLDEPDVHLHPDLQVRLMNFIVELASQEPPFTVLIATHSTAILGALATYPETRVAFMTSVEQERIHFKEISEIHKKVLPIFGANPLSNMGLLVYMWNRGIMEG